MTDPTTVEPRYFRLVRPALFSQFTEAPLQPARQTILVPLRHAFEFQVWRRVQREHLLDLDPETPARWL